MSNVSAYFPDDLHFAILTLARTTGGNLSSTLQRLVAVGQEGDVLRAKLADLLREGLPVQPE